MEQFMDTVYQPTFLIAMLSAIAVFATVFTLLPSLVSRDPLQGRMKSVAIEREEIRARERMRLSNDKDKKKGSLRKDQQNAGVRSIVEMLDLRKALADEKTANKLRSAGFRTQNALNVFLFCRLLLPFLGFGLAAFYVFALNGLEGHSNLMRWCAAIFGAYAGFYAPVLYINNMASKRKQAIQRAWPDALDLMLICVESGMSTEAAFRKVADEIGIQSAALAEELILTNAELSFLTERRMAYENLGNRTQLESIRSTAQALIQAERYGTPVANALRVLSNESREMRMTEAEKKAAALPPKLTVPMIVFFLPVLFAVILGPAGITISQQGGIFPK
jgi:tight adherence protein C